MKSQVILKSFAELEFPVTILASVPAATQPPCTGQEDALRRSRRASPNPSPTAYGAGLGSVHLMEPDSRAPSFWHGPPEANGSGQ